MVLELLVVLLMMMVMSSLDWMGGVIRTGDAAVGAVVIATADDAMCNVRYIAIVWLMMILVLLDGCSNWCRW